MALVQLKGGTMNRRAFFRSLLSAAACVVARAYAPGAASGFDVLPEGGMRRRSGMRFVRTLDNAEVDAIKRRYAALRECRVDWQEHYEAMRAAWHASR